MRKPSTRVIAALEAAGVDFRLHHHESPLHSLEQAAAERNLLPGQIVRSLLFRLEGGSFVLVLVPGPDKLDWGQLRRHLAVSRITTASPEEVLEVTGYEPGAVSPFGLRTPVRILADRAILEYDRISLGAGVRDTGIELDRSQAIDLLQPEWGDFRGQGR